MWMRHRCRAAGMKPLAPQEFAIFELLTKRQQVSREQMEDALWGMAPECDWPKDPSKVISVLLNRLRAWLEAQNIELTTLQFKPGLYTFTGASRERAQYVLRHYWALVAKSPRDTQLDLFAHGRRVHA